MIEAGVEEAYEIIVGGDGSARVVLTCEHASNRVPPPWSWPEEDAWIVDTHWAIDIGAADITRDLALEIGAAAILARYTRLLIDPNRSLTAPSLFRQFADGKRVRLNLDVDDDDAARRIDHYWKPYHTALDKVIGAVPEALVLAMHSFTPVYEGNARAMEIGVLYDRDEVLGKRVASSLSESGFVVAVNEPYSGRNGMMFSAYRHAVAHERPALELEIRQDVAGDVTRHPEIVAAVAKALVDAGAL